MKIKKITALALAAFLAIGVCGCGSDKKTDSEGYIIAGEDCKTKSAGIFVAGDNRTKEVRQLVTAASDGAVAATAAINYLNTI